MDRVFSDMLFLFVIIYLDNILIYSKNLAIHQERVSMVLQRVRENNLLAKPEKCIFHVPTVRYLEFILSPQGIEMDPAKVDSILSWPRPTSVKQIQSFLRPANFYWKFIPTFSAIVQPIVALLKKDVPFNWTKDQESAFHELKQRFTQGPILAQPGIGKSSWWKQMPQITP
ncbi:uncharacterized protein [Ambystoma mexicanum]|uniref:uncharacterized protein n=1 Tax=Ambystoma mexicanum TaxID=8296 RepID=UPI0037E83296